MTHEKQRRQRRKPEVCANLPQDVSYILLQLDEHEEKKMQLCITNYVRFTEVAEKLLQRIKNEQIHCQQRLEKLKV